MRGARAEAVRAAWIRLSDDGRAAYKGSFRRYRKESLAAMLAECQQADDRVLQK